MPALAEKSKVVTVTDAKVNAAAFDKLVTARIGLLLRAPFFGSIATRLKLVNADDWCSTAATDGRRFYYNSVFINSLPLKQIEFLVGHEVLHAVYDHMGRRGHRDAKLFNIAADYCVNGDLIEQRIGETIPSCLHDSKYRGMCAEEVYDILYENADKISIEDLLKKLLDEHMDSEEDEGDGGSGSDDGDDGDDGESMGRPKLSKEEMKEIRDEIKEALIAAVQTVSQENIPGNIKRLVKGITEPQVNWRDLINQRIQSIVKSDYTWTRPSRRSWHMDAIMPGTQLTDAIDVCISIDSSGSMSKEMLQDFLAEVRGIMETFDDYKITIWCIDTKVYNCQTFTPQNVDDFENYEIEGGGGNTFEENWVFMRDNDINPGLFIMFTDGYPCPNWCSPGDEEYCDTLFLLHSTTTIEAPFGATAYYDTKGK